MKTNPLSTLVRAAFATALLIMSHTAIYAADADLSIPVHSHTPPKAVITGQSPASIDYFFTVHNSSTTTTASAVSVTVSATGSQHFDSGIGGSFFHDNGDGTYTANLPDLSAGADRQVGIGFIATAPGPLSATATVSSFNDSNGANNTATETASAVNQAHVDLQMVSIYASPEPANVGDLRHYHGVLYNDGPDKALDIVVGIRADTTPSGQLEYDQYESFVGASPEPSPAAPDANGFRYLPVGDIPARSSISFDVYYTAVKQGSFTRDFFTVETGENSDSNLNNNGKAVFSIIDNNSGPSGLSGLFLTLDGSSAPAGNLADSVLQFAARQSGAPAGIKVRLQTTTTPKTESSWGNLDDGNGGRMVYDSSSDKFVLNSTTYPLGSKIYFRAIYSANTFDDSISNVIGPINLSSTKQHLPPPVLSLIGNGHADDLSFRAAFAASQSGVAVRVQASTDPATESSWFAVGPMTQTRDTKVFLAGSHNQPDASGIYFRAIASKSGSVDGISTPIGPLDVTHDVPPEVAITIISPQPLAKSGPGTSAASPIILPIGSLSVKLSATTGNSIRSLSLRLNSDTKYEVHDGSNSFTYTTTALTPGDYVLEGQAIDSKGGMARETAKKYVRFVATGSSAARSVSAANTSAASGEHTFIAGQFGVWDNPDLWTGLQSGIHRVPGPGDFAVIPKGASVGISFNKPVTVTSLSLGDQAALDASGGTLTVTGTLTLHDRSLVGKANLVIPAGGTANVQNISAIVLGGTTIHCDGRWNLQGTGTLVQLEALYINGSLVFHAPIVPIPAATVLDDPDADAQGIIANTKPVVNGNLSSEERAELLPQIKLISQDGSNFIGSNGANYVPPRLITNGGGAIIGEHGSGLVSEHGGGIIGDGGASLAQTNALMSSAGGGVVSNDGGTSRTPSAIGTATTATPAPSPTGIIQTGGNIDVNGIMLMGGLTIQGGVLSGSGRILGDLTNTGGYITPGHSVGGIGVQGNFTQGAGGTTILEVSGAAADQYDQIAIAGTAKLGGKLDLKATDTYQPSASDYLAPIGFKSASGAFASVSSNGAALVKGDGVRVGVSQPNPKPGQPVNISTRLQIQGGDNGLIAGFIVSGPAGSTKKVIIRALGPSIGVAGAISDPILELNGSGVHVVNDDWQQGDTSQIPNGFAPSNPKESVIVATLTVGSQGYSSFTAGLRDTQGQVGVGVVEVYDLNTDSTAQLANIATRGLVQTGADVLIGGFYVGGNEPATVLVRATGPSLTKVGVTGELQDPLLELHDANGGVISNDNWRETQESEITATQIQPTDEREPAILATLVPGGYTAVVRGVNDTTGVAVIEAYNLSK